jgi:hypothetical protein
MTDDLRLSYCPACRFRYWLKPGETQTCYQCPAGAVVTYPGWWRDRWNRLLYRVGWIHCRVQTGLFQ